MRRERQLKGCWAVHSPRSVGLPLRVPSGARIHVEGTLSTPAPSTLGPAGETRSPLWPWLSQRGEGIGASVIKAKGGTPVELPRSC